VALLPYVTLGVYLVVWWYRINRELRDYGESVGHDLGRSPAKSALAIFPGCFIVAPAIVTDYRGTIQQAARIAGRQPANGWLVLLMYLVFPGITWAYLQSSLTGIWRVAASGSDGPSTTALRLTEGRAIRVRNERTAGVSR
jgi:hypothetical protein